VKPTREHLHELYPSEREAIQAAGEVEAMMASPGWARLLESIEARLRYEQKAQMNHPKPKGDETYDRTIGTWAGMDSLAALASSIVENGRAVEAERRERAA
jgi:hypothetical protein